MARSNKNFQPFFQRHLYQYKESFTDSTVWNVLKEKLKNLISKSWEDRDVDDSHTIERILYLGKSLSFLYRGTNGQFYI